MFGTEVMSGHSRRLMELPGCEWRPSWSPVERHIAFIYSPTRETDTLGLVNLPVYRSRASADLAVALSGSKRSAVW